jgi:hypothetical protein
MKLSKRTATRRQVGQATIATDPTSMGDAKRIAIERLFHSSSLTLPDLAQHMRHSSLEMTACYMRSTK